MTSNQPKLSPEAANKIAEFLSELDERRSSKPRKPGRPSSGKTRVTLMLKPATIAKFRATGPGWQARVSDILDRAKP